MRLLYLYIDSFKNLRNFEIDFDEKHSNVVLLGENATGKSNFLEALILIFKYLDLERFNNIPFNYLLKYKKGESIIEIEKETKTTTIKIDNNKISLSEFKKSKDKYLPKYVFAYYSGTSNRLEELFDEHQKRFYDKLIKENVKEEEIEDLRRLFYVRLIHSKFVLLAFFSFAESFEESKDFLKNYFGIEDIENILFILHTPYWANKPEQKREKFWSAKGIVRDFLEIMWEKSLAPIYNEETIRVDFRSTTKKELLYLFFPSVRELQEIAKNYKDNTTFFKALESTYISDLIEDVKIRVKKYDIDKNITFRELSEGEQQLLTVLGLLKFTRDKESLVLLDEPDTHLNPIWKWKYLDLLKEVIGEDETSHIIINTHDPLIIGGLVKEQIRIFKKDYKDGSAVIEKPDIDPKGLGVAGILTSEFFGLPTTLDKETQEKLEERNRLAARERLGEKLTKEEKEKLRSLTRELELLGFGWQFRDKTYQKVLERLYKREKELDENIYELKDEEFDKLIVEILKELEEEK